MSKKITSIFFFFFIIVISISDCFASVTIDLVQSKGTYQAGNSYSIDFRIKITDSWYIHGPGELSDSLIPTTLSFEETPSIKIQRILFPEPEKKKFNYTDDILDVYSGEIFIKATLLIGDNIQPGEHLIKGRLAYQACSDRLCLPPETTFFDIKLLISPGDTASGLSNPDNDVLMINGKKDEKTFTEKMMDRGFFLSIILFFLVFLT